MAFPGKIGGRILRLRHRAGDCPQRADCGNVPDHFRPLSSDQGREVIRFSRVLRMKHTIYVRTVMTVRRVNVGMLDEFKKFAMRGNVVDMAVGIIIGGAFGKIVSSVVADVVMPPIGLVLGGVDFSALSITLKQGSEGVAAVTLNYGKFVQTVVDFTIIAFAVFLLIKGMNALKKKEAAAPPPAPPPPSKEELLLAEIRDILKQK